LNADRRSTGQVCIELLKECSYHGEMSEASHAALVEAVKLMKQAEFWSLRRQEPHEGKNASTDAGIAISRVALPALENAARALADEEYDTVVEALTLAITTDGTTPPKRRSSDVRKTVR
jgi:hypothetical protein